MFPPFRWMMHRRRGLRTWIISILANAPKNGAEIMDEIETMTQGWWRPSPGSVYPLLDQMTQEDLLKKRDGRGGEARQAVLSGGGFSRRLSGVALSSPRLAYDRGSKLDLRWAYHKGLGRLRPSGSGGDK